MPDDPGSEQELDEIAANLAVAEQSELPLFGLLAPFTGSRELTQIGWHEDVVNHVTLSHQTPTETRIDVTVVGPLHGQTAGGTWSINPLPMIAGKLLTRAGEEFTGGAQWEQREDALLRQTSDEVQILVDDQPWPFRLLREGDHWAALHDIEPNHLLYVVASNTAPTDVQLERLDNLATYSQPLSH